ncbi:flagellar basal body rod protein FlgB [bacterium]|nr:flagellar basal body rod protein FlgB [bacterium]
MISREVRGLERAMDGFAARFAAQANNIANINTPQYARQDVRFEDALISAIDSEPSPGVAEAQDPFTNLFGSAARPTDDMLETFKPSTTATKGQGMRRDGNGVSLEHEMSQLVQSVEKYNTLATQIATQYRTFKFITDQK